MTLWDSVRTKPKSIKNKNVMRANHETHCPKLTRVGFTVGVKDGVNVGTYINSAKSRRVIKLKCNGLE